MIVLRIDASIFFHHGQGKKEMDSDKLIHANVTDRSSSLHITVQSKSD
jgi:hypothetical protein